MKKFLVLMLAMLMLTLPLLVACGDSSEGTKDNNSSTSQGTTDNQGGSEENPLATFPLEEKYFDTTVTILTRDHRYAQQFVATEEYEGSVINAAVQARNDLIEEKYGIKIEHFVTARPGDDIGTYIMNDMDDYDVVSDAVYTMIQHTTEEWFWSLNDLLDLNQPWWDKNAINQLTLSDKVFYVAGDAIFADDLMTAGVLYNKTVYAERYESTYGSLYDMVDKGTWTIDIMAEMAKDFAEPDENGAWMTESTKYGVVTDGYTGATMLTNGSGAVSAFKDEAGNIKLSGGDEASIKAFDKVYNLLNEKTISLYAEQYSPADYNKPFEYFISGNALFRVGYMDQLLGIMESDVTNKVMPGIVPIPKFEEAQEEYHCGINVYQSDVLAIPVSNNENLEATAYALELLGYYSMPESQMAKDSVIHAFYEDTLKYQSIADDNDARMLDLISNNRIYDLGGAFNWGGNLIGLYSFNLYRGSNTLVSTWESELPAVQDALAKTLEAYANSIA